MKRKRSEQPQALDKLQEKKQPDDDELVPGLNLHSNFIEREALKLYHEHHPGRPGRARLQLNADSELGLPSFIVPKLRQDVPATLVPLAFEPDEIPDSLDPAQAEDFAKPKLASERKKQVRDLCKELPEFAPALEWLGHYDQVSEAAATAGDATFSERLALGRVIDKHKHNRTGIVAVAAGSLGTLIRFEMLDKLTIRADRFDKEDDYVTAKLVGHRTGWWDHQNTPVRQLTFSEENGEYGDVLAARFQGSVALFRPEFSTVAKRPNNGYFKPVKSDLPESLVDPRLFAEIEARELFGVDFAHVSFNPAKRQLAIIDILGHWAVWSSQYLHKREAGRQNQPEAEIRGCLKNDKPKSSGWDGWARVVWSRDGTVLFAAQRRIATCYDSRRHYSPMRTPSLVDFDHKHRDWIVDAKRCPLRPTAFWVLTSKRVISISYTDKAVFVLGVAQGPMVIDVADRHGKDKEELDLALEAMVISGTILIIVRGQQDVPVWARSYKLPGPNSPFRLLSGCYSQFTLDTPLPETQNPRSTHRGSLSGMVLLPVVEPDGWKKDSFPRGYFGAGGLVRALLCSQENGVLGRMFSFQPVTEPRIIIARTWKRRSRSSSYASAASIADDFLVDDSDISDDSSSLWPDQWRTGFRRAPVRRKHPRIRDGSHLNSILSHHASASMTDEDAREFIEDAIRGQPDLLPGVYTMFDTIGDIPYNNDFPDTAAYLDGLVQRTQEGIPCHAAGHTTVLSTTAMNFGVLSEFLSEFEATSDISALYSQLFEVCKTMFEETRTYRRRERSASSHRRVVDDDYRGDQSKKKAVVSQLTKVIASQLLLSTHILSIGVAPETLGPSDSTQVEPTSPIDDRMSEANQLPSSSPPPQDVNDPYATTSDLSIPITYSDEPHPFSTLASYGIIGSWNLNPKGGNLEQARRQWTRGKDPSTETWRDLVYGGTPALAQLEAEEAELQRKARALPKIPERRAPGLVSSQSQSQSQALRLTQRSSPQRAMSQTFRDAGLGSAEKRRALAGTTSASAGAGSSQQPMSSQQPLSSPQPTSSQLMSSQQPPSSQRTMPNLQIRSSQVPSQSASQMQSSQPARRGKKRKKGF